MLSIYHVATLFRDHGWEIILMSLTAAPLSNDAQIDYWNTGAGETWVERQAQLDRQLTALGSEAQRVLAPAAGERVLDIGCGCGDTTLQLAERVGPSGAVVGVDISRPMLEVARRRPTPEGAATPTFRELDAQTADLGRGAFDAAFSRFGVMFFADPTAAFANLRRALKPGGRVAFLCWRSPLENPVLTAASIAAAPLLPAPPMLPDPTAPGPFAFADKDRVAGILKGAGFADVAIEPHDAKMGWPDVDTALALALRIGPLGAALRERPDLADKVVGAVRDMLETHRGPDGVMLDSATWIVLAR
jgi:SAM-dependent methyltransferase